MRFCNHGESVDAVIIYHRHQIGVVGGMRAAVIGRVVQERIAALEHGVVLLHRLTHHIGTAQHMNR